jgi:predicted phosphate transport protein (TIGR00153 family)
VGIKEWLIPQDKVFFDLFERLARLVVLSAEELEAMVNNRTDRFEALKKIKDLEHQGDSVTHEIYENLNRTFITPLDPLEISRLASALDDILDYIDDSAEKMINYDISEFDPYMQDFAQLIRLSVVQLECGVKTIRGLKTSATLDSCGIEVNRLENLADDLLARSIQQLFKGKDAINIIKLKDIYECLETATDKCEDVTNVISDISIRHT